MKKLGVFIVLLFASMFAMAGGTTKANLDLGSMGWVVDKRTEDGKAYMIRNKGNNGGVIRLGCNVPGGDVSVKYIYRGLNKDFFIIELLTDARLDSYPYTAMYGVKSLNQAAMYKQFAMTDAGFMMTRFAEGAAERFFKSRKDREVYGLPRPIGTELFVGHEQVADYINDVKATCGFTEEPLH
ncbi:hypothetical protein PQC07_gp023 [Aeromonas phage D3]|uniref:Uncharacterized protein n=2 Tax=Ludhianavirus TaxID=3044751 RepID=A0A514TVE0_9CAUD|nr:hypothetical protein PQC07_gp023 [Aeromonas phage D3]YP_010669000.1 hypothetical protein PQC08_gp023 [Aeromonas phage D6]QDJ96982.1 hypothetical protein D3_0252 [Aeromonas phage D3]QDJ97411.1 hypothetical protein D6_0252 [Aeromonas phage D6]